MSNKYPYILAMKNVSDIISYLRNNFPQGGVYVDTLKSLGMAPNDERRVINVLKFVNVIDDKGNKTEDAGMAFSKHKIEDFQKSFEPLVKEAYSGLFDLRGDSAWELGEDDLIAFFKGANRMSTITSKRQAFAFRALANACGYGATLTATNKNKHKTPSRKGKRAKVLTARTDTNTRVANFPLGKDMSFGLAVKVEINLPAGGTKETYDNIFKSIRENLLDG